MWYYSPLKETYCEKVSVDSRSEMPRESTCSRTPYKKSKKRTSPPPVGLPVPPKSSGRNAESSSRLPPYPPPFRTLSFLPPVAHTYATMCAPGPAANRHFLAPMTVRRSTTSCDTSIKGWLQSTPSQAVLLDSSGRQSPGSHLDYTVVRCVQPWA